MKTMDGPSKIKILSLIVLLAMIVSSCVIYYHYSVYNSIQVDVKKNIALEYGSANYDINDFIKRVEGEIVSVKNDIDTNQVGEQEVLVEVKKANVVKEIPLVIPVVDTVAPVIQLNDDSLTFTTSDDIQLFKIIGSVRDEVDGDLPYAEVMDENSRYFYHFDYDINTIGAIGEHEVRIIARDKSGNEATASYTVKIVAPKVTYYRQIYSNLPANPSGNDVVSIALSLVGSPYISGSNGPYGFDCSGFVQYVYSQVGIYVSRSSNTQINDGLGVSYEDAQPGDILSWGNGYPTHSALYIGNGQMVHATNPRQGVIVSDVAGWRNGSGTYIMSVRRIQ